MNCCIVSILCILLIQTTTFGFAPNNILFKRGRQSVIVKASTEEKAAPSVNGEELEIMLTEWDLPLVVDAYATWCGPCLLMAPEFEKAAQELKGRVRFVKLDTDLYPEMAGRLNIMGLPTVLFLDVQKLDGEKDDSESAKAVLKDRVEGALRQESIVALCEHNFFDGPRPEQL
mmetsp:Transcript_3170/g.3036  ORF Transcript_3170/g.3036 Transcript_3170/m.3036 type:complete len:173 (-) Transcript_3170:428-946(-)|eukprot:CAMPEP_0197831990 /NCGR_PEP_ID=MMETSP1437-20131217/12886_1 /TAXON_ID=49252 ORGANISM="Eucampia antarctica, Strain CCMP1452" /NCGR_SAMPLE_ID=MMETSP1437 /ASSEMBLY_ACC=CAM_ASM_001096 /LENGTH=172 /DNA_ID=CAMNT_0043435145 /DNA_START=77 /DNA_END=595 /DNA_ORIENTATION=+